MLSRRNALFGLLAMPALALFSQRVLAGPVPVKPAFAEHPDTGITAWMLTSTTLVLLMVPGLALFYGGLVRTRNVLGTIMHSFAAMAIIGVLWAVVGYAMTFGHSVFGGIIGWDWGKFLLTQTDTAKYALGHSDGVTRWIPEAVYAMFQGKFAIITPALIAGAFAERVRFRGYCLFIALWSLLVYNPLAHIVWGGGFLTHEAIDFAGGTVIHISAGISGLVAVFYLGARRGYPKVAMHPNNLVMTMLGAGLLWVGWFGFNAGSSVNSGQQTAQALMVTQIAAATGALTWILIEAIHHGKATVLGMASGIITGLVAITPAAGNVPPWGAIMLGGIASMGCYLAILLKNHVGYDDTLDVFGIHGVAGIIGAIGLTFFLRAPLTDAIVQADGTIVEVARSLGTQLVYQLKGVGVSIGFAAVATAILVVLVDKTVGLRVDVQAEMAGMDHALHGEHGYGFLNVG